MLALKMHAKGILRKLLMARVLQGRSKHRHTMVHMQGV